MTRLLAAFAAMAFAGSVLAVPPLPQASPTPSVQSGSAKPKSGKTKTAKKGVKKGTGKAKAR